MNRNRPLSEHRPDELVELLRKWSGGARMGDEPSVTEIIAEIERRYVQPVDRSDAEARAYELGRRDERRQIESEERLVSDWIFECRSADCDATMILTTEFEGELREDEIDCPVCGSIMVGLLGTSR